MAPLLSLELLARGPPLVYHFAPLSVLTDTHAQTQSRSTASTPTFSDAFFSQFRKPFYFSFRYIFNLFLFLHYLSLSLSLPWVSCFFPLRLAGCCHGNSEGDAFTRYWQQRRTRDPDAAGTRATTKS